MRLSTFFLYLMALFSSVLASVSYERRFYGCRNDTIMLPGVMMTSEDSLNDCFDVCTLSNNFTFAGATNPRIGTGESISNLVECYCAEPVMSANVDASNCNATCPTESTLFCGSADSQFQSVYVEATMMGAMVFSDCHDLTYESELTTCRSDLALTFAAVSDVVIANFTAQFFFFVGATYSPDQCTVSPTGCWLNPDAGGLNATCSFDSANGHRTCACPPGYADAVPENASLTYIPGTNCTDIDECADGVSRCTGYQSMCENTIGDHICTCNPLFTDVNGDGTVCTAFNECLLPVAPICDRNAFCTVLDSGDPRHTCTCNMGYFGNGTTCVNVDECASSSTPCDNNANCTDTVGSYTCECRTGYIELPDGSCQLPAGSTSLCSGNPDPVEYDRRVIWAPSCSVAVLINCSESNDVTEGERVVVESTTNAQCMDDELVTTLSSTFVLDNAAAFASDGGRSLLNSQVECTSDGFSITIDRTVANQAGFHLGNLFLGGYGDYTTAEAAFNSEFECKGQPWYQDGIQYKFEAEAGSTACGTQHTESATEITYTNALRGRYDMGGSAGISRLLEIFIGFSCNYNTQSNVASSSYFVYSGRRKRDTEISETINLPEQEVSLQMALYRDRAISVPYAPSVQVTAGNLIYVEVNLPNSYRGRFEIQILRCWQTTTSDGQGPVYKNIIANGCDSSQWTKNGNVLLQSSDASSIRFGFPVQSLEGDNENIYVSCMLDVLDKLVYSNFQERCSTLIPSPSTFRADVYMKVVTVGPISVRDVCGGTYNGGCEQSCSVTSQQTALCYCLPGFEVDPRDPTRCLLQNPATPRLSSEIYWYYYVIPILILLLLIVLVGLAIYKVRKSREGHSGKYVLTEAEGTSASADGNDFLH